jgi:pimeloyl-ACP methyl ester carboxylesterase
MRTPVDVPVLQVRGGLDAALTAGSTIVPAGLVEGPLTYEALMTTGHFPHEEAPGLFNNLLLDWLRTLP